MEFQVILLPGGVLPADPAYSALIAELGADVDARAKELEMYRGTEVPPAGWSIATEVEGIERFADAAGFDRFHLVGYSAGGASSLAFCATHPDRLLSLTLNEPAWAGHEGESEGERGRWERFGEIAEMSDADRMPAFIRAQLADGVPLPPPPEGPPPPWMPSRILGLAGFIGAFIDGELDLAPLRSFDRPVLFTLGGRSHPDYYAQIAERLANVFPDFTVERYEDRHHFDPPHRVEPARMAASLRRTWGRAEAR